MHAPTMIIGRSNVRCPAQSSLSEGVLFRRKEPKDFCLSATPTIEAMAGIFSPAQE
jgi:hypothetical protein